MLCRRQLIYAIHLGNVYQVGIVQLVCNGKSLFGCDISIDKMILSGHNLLVPLIINIIRYHTFTIHIAKEITQLDGCVKHCDVSLASGKYFVEELREAVDKFQLFLACICNRYCCH